MSYRLKILISMVSACLLVFNGARAQTLNEVVETTLRTNPDIQSSRYNVEAADELRKQARSAYFPTLDLVIATGEEVSDNTTTRAAGLDELRLDRVERSLRLTQLLYDGFGTRNLVRQQTHLVDAATARLASTQDNTSLRAIQVYLEVLRRDAIVQLTAKNLDHHDKTLAKIQERFESGVGTKVDVVQTMGRRAQAKSSLLLAERDARNGRAEFYRIVGEYPNALTEPSMVSGLPGTLEQTMELAFLNNPGLEAAALELEAAVSARKQTRGAFHPRFDLEVAATRNDDTDGTLGANDDETAVIRMTYNLYRGGADRARMNEAEAREFAAREALASTRRAVQEDATLIWNELSDILVRMEFLRAHVSSTEEVLDVYNEQLTLGKRTLLDLLDVQNELLRAQTAELSGRYVAMLARYRVLTSTGQLLEHLGVTVR